MTEERKAFERLLLRFAGLLLLIASIIWILPEVWHKFSPFIVSTPLAAMLQPVIKFLQKKLKFKRSPATLIPVLLLLVAVLGVLIWLFTTGITQVARIVSGSGNLLTDSINAVRTALNNMIVNIGSSTSPAVEQWLRGAVANAVQRLSDWGADAAEQLVNFSINMAASMPYVIIYISFLTIGLYFISKNYDDIRSYLPGGKRRKQDSRATQLTNSTVKGVFGYLRVQGTFGLMVWIVSWIYLEAFGFTYAGITALFCGIMEMVPMIGSGGPYIVMALLQFMQGKTRLGILLTILTLGLQLLRRVLEPKLMANRIGISPLQSLIGMFVGMQIGGIIGLIGGPVMMSVLVGAYKSGIFYSTDRDIKVVSAWLRNRLK
jgi:sporulation integral membrane protein YtvI